MLSEETCACGHQRQLVQEPLDTTAKPWSGWWCGVCQTMYCMNCNVRMELLSIDAMDQERSLDRDLVASDSEEMVRVYFCLSENCGKSYEMEIEAT